MAAETPGIQRPAPGPAGVPPMRPDPVVPGVVGSGPRPGARGSFAAVKLLRHSHRWAAARGAETLMVHATGGIAPDRTRMGFQISGGNYAAPLAQGPPDEFGVRGVPQRLQGQASHLTGEGR